MASVEWRSGVAGFRFRLEGTPDALRQPITDPLHGLHFAYRVQGFVLEPNPTLLIETFAPSQPLYPFAQRACRLLLHCYELVRTRLKLDHPLRYDRLLRVFLCREGKPGAEQQQNLIYLYQVSEQTPPAEWLRELTHEYGHFVLPPINSFTEPEAWANGDLGERLLGRWLLHALEAGQIDSETVMGVSVSALRAYVRRVVQPLVERMAQEGLSPRRWRSRKRDGYEEYLALALYAEQVYGAERLGRAMRIAGGVEPDDFLNGLRESLLEQPRLKVTLLRNPAWLLLPGGTRRWRILSPPSTRLTPDPKRPDWVQCSSPEQTVLLQQVNR
ncbi:MAG: hypothetical protein NZL85_08165 [Fimbriimonadales bacterium]|nr:hypothetical protein [Fimbriimonadales bacterium]